jgi:oligopeptide/dipeptide ABC transporter ATP-binding protein
VADDTNTPLLQVEDLRTSFDTPDGPVRALDGVTFELDAGQALGVVGESGSGKTVLSRSIMGLFAASNVRRSGRVLLRGNDISALPPKKLRQYWGLEIAMIFQDPMTSLNPVLTVGKQVTEGLRDRMGMSRSEAHRTIVELFDEVGISDPERRLRAYPHELSGGLRQRVMIASALSCGPSLLLADEPTTALDVTVQAQILDLLDRERRQRHMSMILVTHDLGVVAGRTDAIAVMYAGRIVEFAPTADLFANMQMPYTEALLESNPRLDTPSHTILKTIGGRPPNLRSPLPGCSFAPRCRYVQDRCRAEAPPLVPTGSDSHLAACWFPIGRHVEQPVALGMRPAVASASGPPT